MYNISNRVKWLPALSLLLTLLVTALNLSTACQAADAALTPEQRKMQAYAERQYNRGRMAAARGQVKDASKHYVEAINTFEKYFGENDERLIEPLAAQTQLYAGPMQKPNKKQRALLERLLALYDALGKSGQERAIVMAQLGDWWVTANDETKSTDYYQKAWAAIASDEGAEEANRQFSKARQLFFEPPVYRPRRSDGIGHTTVVTYSIDTSGRIYGLSMVESDAPPDITSGLTSALKRRRYRPVIIDGALEPVTDVTISFTYSGNGGLPVEELVPL